MGKLLKSFLTAAVESSGNTRVPSTREIHNKMDCEANIARMRAERQLAQETDPDKRIVMMARIASNLYDFSDL